MVAHPVTTAAWVQVVAATSQPCSAIEVSNPSNSLLKIAVGGAGSEVELPYYVLPGGSPILLPWEIAKGSRISLKAVQTTANVGLFVLNLFG